MGLYWGKNDRPGDDGTLQSMELLVLLLWASSSASHTSERIIIPRTVIFSSEEAIVTFSHNLLTHFKISLKPPHALQQFWAFMPIDFFLLTGSLFEYLCQYDADAADADVADPAESDIWPIYDWYMTDIWPIYDWYMADIWLIYDFNFLVVLCRDTAAS